jgi:hypothetical protein
MERCTEEQILSYWPLLQRWQQKEMANQLQVIEALDQVQAKVGFAPQALNPSLALS